MIPNNGGRAGGPGADKASTSLRTQKISGLFRSAAKPQRLQLLEDAEPDDPDDDQVDRHDVIQQPRHQQNEDSADERHDGGDVADADGHDGLPVGWIESRRSVWRAGGSRYPRPPLILAKRDAQS